MGRARNRARKGGFKKKEGDREPSGRLQRNVPDPGTPELKARKVTLMRTDRFEISPLGILAGHKLITEEMYLYADRYRTIFFSAHPDSDRPVAPLPFLAKLPSAPSPLDVTPKQADELYLRHHFSAMRDKMTNEQQEIVHTLAIYGEWPPIIEKHAHEIVSHRLRWDDELGLTHGLPPSTSLKKAVAAIRDALEALAGPKKRLPIGNEKDIETHLKLV